MPTSSTRRDFLVGAVGLPCLTAAAAALPQQPAEEAPLFDLSLAQWSNHRALQGGLTNLDWISSVRAKYDVSAVEFVNSFFKDKAHDWAYLGEMKLRALDGGVRMLLIMCDGEGSLAAEDEAERRAAIDNHRKWVVAASYLGCHSIRVNAAGSGDEAEMQKRAADSLVQLADYGAPYDVNVIVENHGGRSSNGAWLAGVMRLADHPRVGTLPDFGNFHLGGDEWYDRYEGVREMMPWAKAVSAKSHDFDEQGNEVHTDYRRMLKIVVEAGYRGFLGIEYEGDQLGEDEGILATRDLLRRVREELA
ncbi:MAG: TIM barrel protein [Planctomycetes bacterium]|nr:TIM barrel protein [Planctomycetota bacterium]